MECKSDDDDDCDDSDDCDDDDDGDSANSDTEIMRRVVDEITGAENDGGNEDFDDDNDEVGVYDVKNETENDGPTSAGNSNSSSDNE